MTTIQELQETVKQAERLSAEISKLTEADPYKSGIVLSFKLWNTT